MWLKKSVHHRVTLQLHRVTLQLCHYLLRLCIHIMTCLDNKIKKRCNISAAYKRRGVVRKYFAVLHNFT